MHVRVVHVDVCVRVRARVCVCVCVRARARACVGCVLGCVSRQITGYAQTLLSQRWEKVIYVATQAQVAHDT